MPPKNAEVDKEKKKRERTKTASRCSSRNNSRQGTPLGSPNKFSALEDEADDEETDEAWTCEKCKIIFTSPKDMLMECQRCKEHYCITCLGKTPQEYEVLAASDSMWFCYKCREKVAKDIAIDRKIEEKCKELMSAMESRIGNVESEVKTKCDAKQVRDIVNEEIGKSATSKPSGATSTEAEGTNVAATAVMKELEERKKREGNLVIYGVDELDSQSREERTDHDTEKTLEVLNSCKTPIQAKELTKIIRLGRFDKEKEESRPILVTLKEPEKKANIFKGAVHLKETEKWKDVKLSNDLTKTERENEKALFSKAKDMEKNCKAGCKYKVRGPPWARRIAKMQPEDK